MSQGTQPRQIIYFYETNRCPIAQVIKDENGRPFIVVREYVALRGGYSLRTTH